MKFSNAVHYIGDNILRSHTVILNISAEENKKKEEYDIIFIMRSYTKSFNEVVQDYPDYVVIIRPHLEGTDQWKH